MAAAGSLDELRRERAAWMAVAWRTLGGALQAGWIDLKRSRGAEQRRGRRWPGQAGFSQFWAGFSRSEGRL
jgi:hypothetical protein